MKKSNFCLWNIFGQSSFAFRFNKPVYVFDFLNIFYTLFFLDEIQNDITHSKDEKCFLDISNFNKLHI